MVVTVPAPLASAVERIVGVAGTRWSAQSGSSLNSLFRVDAGNDAAFCVKVNAHTDLAMFEAEGAGLAAIADTRAVRVPRVLGAGRTGTHAFLVLEWLELEGASRGPALGNALAALHRFTSTRFGWHRNFKNELGSDRKPTGAFPGGGISTGVLRERAQTSSCVTPSHSDEPLCHD